MGTTGTSGTTGTTGTRNALALALFIYFLGHGVGHGAAGQLPTQEKAEAPARGAISGVVVDGVSGAPVPDAMVALGGAALPREDRSEERRVGGERWAERWVWGWR